MNIIPKSAIRLLELQSVELSSIGLQVSETKAQANTREGKGLFKRFKKGASTEASISQLHSKKKHHYALNVAAWLRFGLVSDERLVTLCLSYIDSTGEYVGLVEEQLVKDKTSPMFSSSIEIESSGPIIGLRVACAGLQADDRCYIEEINVSRRSEDTRATA